MNMEHDTLEEPEAQRAPLGNLRRHSRQENACTYHKAQTLGCNYDEECWSLYVIGDSANDSNVDGPGSVISTLGSDHGLPRSPFLSRSSSFLHYLSPDFSANLTVTRLERDHQLDPLHPTEYFPPWQRAMLGFKTLSQWRCFDEFKQLFKTRNNNRPGCADAWSSMWGFDTFRDDDSFTLRETWTKSPRIEGQHAKTAILDLQDDIIEVRKLVSHGNVLSAWIELSSVIDRTRLLAIPLSNSTQGDVRAQLWRELIELDEITSTYIGRPTRISKSETERTFDNNAYHRLWQDRTTDQDCAVLSIWFRGVACATRWTPRKISSALVDLQRALTDRGAKAWKDPSAPSYDRTRIPAAAVEIANLDIRLNAYKLLLHCKLPASSMLLNTDGPTDTLLRGSCPRGRNASRSGKATAGRCYEAIFECSRKILSAFEFLCHSDSDAIRLNWVRCQQAYTGAAILGIALHESIERFNKDHSTVNRASKMFKQLLASSPSNHLFKLATCRLHALLASSDQVKKAHHKQDPRPALNTSHRRELLPPHSQLAAQERPPSDTLHKTSAQTREPSTPETILSASRKRRTSQDTQVSSPKRVRQKSLLSRRASMPTITTVAGVASSIPVNEVFMNETLCDYPQRSGKKKVSRPSKKSLRTCPLIQRQGVRPTHCELGTREDSITDDLRNPVTLSPPYPLTGDLGLIDMRQSSQISSFPVFATYNVASGTNMMEKASFFAQTDFATHTSVLPGPQKPSFSNTLIDGTNVDSLDYEDPHTTHGEWQGPLSSTHYVHAAAAILQQQLPPLPVQYFLPAHAGLQPPLQPPLKVHSLYQEPNGPLIT